MTKPMTATRSKVKVHLSERAAGKVKPRDAFPFSHNRNEEMEEVISRVLASVRDNIRTLPPERYDEIFAEFAEAVEKQSIGYLADTIANWALGGHGYKTADAVVNRALDDFLR